MKGSSERWPKRWLNDDHFLNSESLQTHPHRESSKMTSLLVRNYSFFIAAAAFSFAAACSAASASATAHFMSTTPNPQERWGTHKKRWPFQPRPFADVIGLVRRSYENILEIKIWTQSHGGLVQMIFLFNWVNFSLQPFIFQGCFLSVGRNATSIHQSWWMYPLRFYVTTTSCGNGFSLPFPPRQISLSFRMVFFWWRVCETSMWRLRGIRKRWFKSTSETWWKNLEKNQRPYRFCWNRIFKDGDYSVTFRLWVDFFGGYWVCRFVWTPFVHDAGLLDVLESHESPQILAWLCLVLHMFCLFSTFLVIPLFPIF